MTLVVYRACDNAGCQHLQEVDLAADSNPHVAVGPWFNVTRPMTPDERREFQEARDEYAREHGIETRFGLVVPPSDDAPRPRAEQLHFCGEACLAQHFARQAEIAGLRDEGLPPF